MVDKYYTLSLMVTEKCNLNCIYCYEHYKTLNNMSFETAKIILDKELMMFNFKNKLVIDFFGGEPFSNFPLIKKIVLYVETAYKENLSQIKFFTTTNGTLINNEIKDFLLERKKYFIVGLSLDGNREAHNINRSNSFDLIDLNFFLDNYPFQPIKMTISKDTLKYLYESIKYLTKLGFLINCNFAYGTEWNLKSDIIILEQELEKLIDFYVENPKISRARILDYDIKHISYVDNSLSTVKKWCGCGKYMSTYTVNGKKYPCQMFTPISNRTNSELPNIESDIPKILLDDKCKKCIVQSICPTCYGINYLSRGNPYSIDNIQCELNKVVYKANAKLQALLWKTKKLNLNKNEEQALLRAIKKIVNI